MAASDVAAAPLNPANGIGSFEPSVWGDFFANYTNPISKESQERMRERARRLQGEVRLMFEAAMTKKAVDLATLVDTIEHLGIDHFFREEIAAAMSRVRSDEELEFSSSNDLHVVALRFRLLRQHGIWVSADVFDTFRDGNTGSFSRSLCSNPRGLLSLYNAAHMAIIGEKALDDAIAFARRHLEAIKDELKSPLADQVARDIDIPLPRTSQLVENMHYIVEYEQEEGHNPKLLELARLRFQLVRCLYIKELREQSLWWRDMYNDVKLPYTRDRAVETFFWACVVIPEEENSRARMMFARIIAYTSLMDDTYDVHATLEDSRNFNQAIQRWDESAVSVVPDYLRRLYLRTLKEFQEFEDMLESNEKYRMSYVINAYKQQSEYYLQEATWADQSYEPSFEEHVRMSTMSSGIPMLALVPLMGSSSGDSTAIRAALEWEAGVPDMVLAGGQVGRLLNDMSASYTMRKNKKDVANTHDCYMKEFNVTGAEAFEAIAGMTEKAWRTINQRCMEIDPMMLPAVQMSIVNLTRSMELIYSGKGDAYTFASNLKGLITSLLLKPIIAV